MKNLIFLDFDGVLNRCTEEGILITRNPSMLERGLVTNVARLVARTGAAVVLSTTWRENESLSHLKWLLEQHGLSGRHVVGTTPILPDELGRGQEIVEFLEEVRPPVRFVVLDDNSEGRFDMTPVRRHFVRVNPVQGFSGALLGQAEAMLTSGPIWSPMQLIARRA